MRGMGEGRGDWRVGTSAERQRERMGWWESIGDGRRG